MQSVPSVVIRGVRSRNLPHQISRCYGAYWNKDWRPATKLPQTEEERRAAAKKYGLIPQDYETYPDDGTGYGDYPKLPAVSSESRDPHACYDMPEFKRNFGEPMHVDYDLYSEERYDCNKRPKVPYNHQLMQFIGVMGITGALFLIFQNIRFAPCIRMPLDRLGDGRKHYTFELEDVE